ncbi:MAG: CvpA family protein [Chitinophagaceae bacterium]
MNWVDILLALILLVAIIGGWYRGFILGSLDLISWLGSLVIGYAFYPYTARILNSFLTLNSWLLPVAFLLTVLIVRLLIGLITRFIVRAIPEDTNNSGINKFLGVIPGAVNGLVYIIIISALLLALPLQDSITKETRNSRFAGPLAMRAEWANRKLAPVFDEAVRQTMNSLTVHPKSNEKVSLTFKSDNAVVRPFLEIKMLELVNEERAKAGLKPVKADPELTRVARNHSQDMFKRGYFAHMNPDGQDPFDRMKASNVQFRAAGENLALAQTLEIAHINLMNSPGHRANILNPAFGRLGIGILDGGYYGLMISQEFRD